MKRRAHVFLGMSLAVFCCAGCTSPTLISFEDIDGNSAELRPSSSSDSDDAGTRSFRLAAGDALGQEIFAEYVALVRASQPDPFEYATGESDYNEPAPEPVELATGESDDDPSAEPAEVVTGESDPSSDDPSP